MGFKEGQGLGKDRAGDVDPLEVMLKSGRAGLGVDESKHRAKREYREFKETVKKTEVCVHAIPEMPKG